MRYVDGYIVPVPAGKREAYRALAEKTWEMLKEFGATNAALHEAKESGKNRVVTRGDD